MCTCWVLKWIKLYRRNPTLNAIIKMISYNYDNLFLRESIQVRNFWKLSFSQKLEIASIYLTALDFLGDFVRKWCLIETGFLFYYFWCVIWESCDSYRKEFSFPDNTDGTSSRNNFFLVSKVLGTPFLNVFDHLFWNNFAKIVNG